MTPARKRPGRYSPKSSRRERNRSRSPRHGTGRHNLEGLRGGKLLGRVSGGGRLGTGAGGCRRGGRPLYTLVDTSSASLARLDRLQIARVLGPGRVCGRGDRLPLGRLQGAHQTLPLLDARFQLGQAGPKLLGLGSQGSEMILGVLLVPLHERLRRLLGIVDGGGCRLAAGESSNAGEF